MMVKGVRANFKYQGSEKEIILPIKKPAWKLIVQLLHDTFHIPQDCFLYLTYIDDSENYHLSGEAEDRTVTVSHDEDLESLWMLMTKKKQLSLDVHLSSVNLSKENIPDNHADRSSFMHQPMIRGKSCARDKPKISNESYLRAKQCFLQQEEQALITSQEVEQILNKILCLPEAQQIWKSECLEILKKKKQNSEKNPIAAFEKTLSENFTETLAKLTKTLLSKYHCPFLSADEEEKNENAHDSRPKSTQIQDIEMHKSEVIRSFKDRMLLNPDLKNRRSKEDPEPIRIMVPNDFEKEFVLQIRDGKARFFAQTIHKKQNNGKCNMVQSRIFKQSEILHANLKD